MSQFTLVGAGRQRVRVRLGGQPVVLIVWWLRDQEVWVYSVTHDNQESIPIVLSRQLQPWVPMIRKRAFRGDLFAVNPADPSIASVFDRDAWTSGWLLYYDESPPSYRDTTRLS